MAPCGSVQNDWVWCIMFHCFVFECKISIFKHQIEGRNFVLHLSKYCSFNMTNNLIMTHSEGGYYTWWWYSCTETCCFTHVYVAWWRCEVSETGDDNFYFIKFSICILSDVKNQFWYISNKMQCYTVYLFLETALHVSGGASTHHQEHIKLYLHHLALFRP